MATVVEQPRVHRRTRDEYRAMGQIGLFDGKRVELLEGEVIERSPIDGPHATGVTLVDDELRAVFGRAYVVRIRQPIDLGEASEPEPDAASFAAMLAPTGLPERAMPSPLSPSRTQPFASLSCSPERTSWVPSERNTSPHS